jgi:hypothetical protein
MTAHQLLDATAACSTALSPQLGVDAWAAIASVGFAMDMLDVVDEFAVGDSSLTLQARAPSIITRWRNPKHVAQDPHRIVATAIFDEAESHFGAPAKIF